MTTSNTLLKTFIYDNISFFEQFRLIKNCLRLPDFAGCNFWTTLEPLRFCVDKKHRRQCEFLFYFFMVISSDVCCAV